MGLLGLVDSISPDGCDEDDDGGGGSGLDAAIYYHS